MLITLLAIGAVFFIVRGLMLRYGSKAVLSNTVATAIVCAFLAGFFTNFLVFTDRRPLITSAPAVTAPVAVAPAAVTLPGKAVSPAKGILSQAQLDRLLPAGPAKSYGVIESMGGSGPNPDQFPAGTTIFIHGWAGDPATKAAAAGLLLIVDGKRRFDVTAGYGGDRIDVATAFKTMAMLHTNVAAAMPTTGLSKGQHRLELAAIHRDGKHYQIILAPKSFTLN
jgi:hypothetical protein